MLSFRAFVTLLLLSLTDAQLLPQHRKDHVVEALYLWNHQLSPADMDAKLCAMIPSAFKFYRGTDYLFFKDFAKDPRREQFQVDTWIQGDLHTENYGIFSDHSHHIVFNVNDFDESVIADFQFDVWRMATSVLLSLRDIGMPTVQEEVDSVGAFVRGYLHQVHLPTCSHNTTLQYTKEDSVPVIANLMKEMISRGKTKQRVKFLDKWAPVSSSGERRFDFSNPKLGKPPPSIVSMLTHGGMERYKSSLSPTAKSLMPLHPGYFTVKDIANRLLAGTGSLGAERYYILVEGNTTSQDDDVILDMKQQGWPSAYLALDDHFRGQYHKLFSSDAERHSVAYQTLTQGTDYHLGHAIMEGTGKGFSFRNKNPFDEGIDMKRLSLQEKQDVFWEMGRSIATDHCRGSDYKNGDFALHDFQKRLLAKLHSKEQLFANLVWEVAFGYAAQVRTDYQLWNEELSSTNYPLSCGGPLPTTHEVMTLAETPHVTTVACALSASALLLAALVKLSVVLVQRVSDAKEPDSYGVLSA